MSAENGVSASSTTMIGRSRPLPGSRWEPPWADGERHPHQAHRGPSITHAPASSSARHIQVVSSPPLDEPLPPDDFLLQLRREKRRVERSRAPLSIVLYHIDGADTQFDRLLDLLHQLKRETDLLGHVGDGMLAVLCPDTDADGVKAFVRKIEDHTEGLEATSVAATYPDHLFDRLADASRVDPELPATMLADSPGSAGREYPLKRSIDILGALVALCLFGPVMVVVALAIRLTSPGPVIFKQVRVGKGGTPFAFYKFRSMIADGDDRIHRKFVADLIKGGQAKEAAASDGAQAGAEARVYKMTSDPRITPIGRFIRKTSIDELPQLFNVLRGDMSLVGPRPPIPYETANYQAWHLRRVLTVKPGITGLWQVDGRSRVNFNEMVRMDLQYIRHCSLGTDLRILLKTVRVVLRGEGAS